jgi:hypothetical protein
MGAPARRAASSTVSSGIASAALHNGVNVTRIRRFSHFPEKLLAVAGVYTCKTSEEFMSSGIKTTEETKLAEAIVGALDADAVRVCSDDRDSIRFSIRAAGMKLRSIVLRRWALRRLLSDPAGPVKIEYLQRELRTAATQRIEYAYPRKSIVRKDLPKTFAPLAQAR